MQKAEIFKESPIPPVAPIVTGVLFIYAEFRVAPYYNAMYYTSAMTNKSIEKHLGEINESGKETRVRLLAFFSAAIAAGEPDSIRGTLLYFKRNEFDHRAIYETILQCYLFLGFPRMIEAAIYHSEIYEDRPETYQGNFAEISEGESRLWFQNGVELCRTVYGKNYQKLNDRFQNISPEIFRWMVIEGYGKVLSRPGLNSIERELAEVAALIVDKRERQLVSHVMGSLNVGAEMSLIEQVNEDIRPIAGEDSYALAKKVMQEIRN